ncbi:hypothetical protein RB2150_03608 [Rhodobacterales bacterium HTCC2150]|nr:hypothetical protein RB2150_03608 [Rhodobacterales bacterium HTCC2150] [Rhodobacteraceae bacterium HTCC2150]
MHNHRAINFPILRKAAVFSPRMTQESTLKYPDSKLAEQS